MITIDCKNSLAIRDQLLEFVADKLEVIPILQSKNFLLIPFDDSQKIDRKSLLSAIVEFLKSQDLDKNFQIIPKGDIIKIEPHNGEKLQERIGNLKKDKKELFFECTHCGFLTRYEVEWRNHKLIHYI